MSTTWTLSPEPEPLPPSTGPLVGAGLDAEQRTVFAFVLCLFVVLVQLMVPCMRILLDPYSRMPASSWTDHKEALERGQFD
ncbi:cortexin-1-like [Tenrec ecaudatus]|uniref:cortexin-1-like n=1 Tax=Tenrec ecaudatus TaxID=94439 RepID=UPI003F5A0FCF